MQSPPRATLSNPGSPTRSKPPAKWKWAITWLLVGLAALFAATQWAASTQSDSAAGDVHTGAAGLQHTASARLQASTKGTARALRLPEASQQTVVSSRPPYRFPKVILQTVADKGHISCETLQHILSWKKMNPGYTHKLFNDSDILSFMKKYYPEHLDTFLALPSSIERTDLWRYLALGVYGGVYADTDVRCLRPIDEWNADHNHDAKVLIGLEGVNEQWHRGSQFLQWAIAAVPGHPLLRNMAMYVKSFRLHDDLEDRNEIVLHRTGPARWTDAILDYMQQHGGVPSKKALQEGVKVDDTRILPVHQFALGWGETCDQVAERHNATYICHQYHGTWKQNFSKARHFSHDCQVPEELQADVEV